MVHLFAFNSYSSTYVTGFVKTILIGTIMNTSKYAIEILVLLSLKKQGGYLSAIIIPHYSLAI